MQTKTYICTQTNTFLIMATILNPQSISLSRLNNAEYTYFAGQIVTRILADTAEALHVPAATLAAYKANYEKMVELVAQSRISEETAEIAEVDSEEDAIIVYINATIRNAKSSPLSDKKAAGTALYNVTKPYIGIQRLPQRQQVQKVSGLLSDLAKEEVATYIETLGLVEEIERLDTLNARYLDLLTRRADSQVTNAVESAKPIRTEMDAQYNEMITTAWAFSIATPSDVLTAFIVFLNKLIDDTNTAYNQRMAQSGKKEEKEQ